MGSVATRLNKVDYGNVETTSLASALRTPALFFRGSLVASRYLLSRAGHRAHRVVAYGHCVGARI